MEHVVRRGLVDIITSADAINSGQAKRVFIAECGACLTPTLTTTFDMASFDCYAAEQLLSVVELEKYNKGRFKFELCHLSKDNLGDFRRLHDALEMSIGTEIRRLDVNEAKIVRIQKILKGKRAALKMPLLPIHKIKIRNSIIPLEQEIASLHESRAIISAKITTLRKRSKNLRNFIDLQTQLLVDLQCKLSPGDLVRWESRRTLIIVNRTPVFCTLNHRDEDNFLKLRSLHPSKLYYLIIQLFSMHRNLEIVHAHGDLYNRNTMVTIDDAGNPNLVVIDPSFLGMEIKKYQEQGFRGDVRYIVEMFLRNLTPIIKPTHYSSVTEISADELGFIVNAGDLPVAYDIYGLAINAWVLVQAILHNTSEAVSLAQLQDLPEFMIAPNEVKYRDGLASFVRRSAIFVDIETSGEKFSVTREQLMQSVYQSWLKYDPEAARGCDLVHESVVSPAATFKVGSPPSPATTMTEIVTNDDGTNAIRGL